MTAFLPAIGVPPFTTLESEMTRKEPRNVRPQTQGLRSGFSKDAAKTEDRFSVHVVTGLVADDESEVFSESGVLCSCVDVRSHRESAELSLLFSRDLGFPPVQVPSDIVTFEMSLS